MDVIAFNKTKGSYGWMSNMSAHKVRYKEEWFKTAEHLFQFMRFEGMKPITFTNREGKEVVLDADRIKKEIVAKSSPMLAKTAAKKYHQMSDEEIADEEKRNVTHEAEAEARHAKKVAQKYRKYHTTTIDQDVESMKKAIRLKLAFNSELIQQLLATNGKIIIEDATTRDQKSGRIWGAVLQADGSWAGDNRLGRIWMEIRDELIKYFGVEYDKRSSS